VIPSDELVREATTAFCDARGLRGDGALAAWLAAKGVSAEQFAERMREDAQILWVRTVLAPQVARQLAAEAQLAGVYGEVVERARAKGRALGDVAEPTLDALGLGPGEDALWRWFFEERRGAAVPGDIDGYARAAGFADRGSLRRAALRDYAFLRGTRMPA
jgi:hypothetical protein